MKETYAYVGSRWLGLNRGRRWGSILSHMYTLMLALLGLLLSTQSVSAVDLDFNQWESVVGGWSIVDGVYVNTGFEQNTNAFVEIEQQGESLSYEWIVEFRETRDSLGPTAGLHILSDNLGDAQRGNSYLIAQGGAEIIVYKTGEGRAQRVKSWAVKAVVGETHIYRVVFNTETGLMEIFRDGSLIGSWTDTQPIRNGRYVSVRTNATIAAFRKVAFSSDGEASFMSLKVQLGGL